MLVPIWPGHSRPSRPVVVEEDADPSVDSTFVLQSVACQPVLQVVKEFRGFSAP